MFSNRSRIFEYVRLAVFMAVSVIGVSACTDAPRRSAGIPHAASTLPPEPVAIALGPVSAFEFDRPRDLQSPLTAAQFTVVELPFGGQASSLLRARAPVSSRQTAGATLMSATTVLGQDANNVPTGAITPWPTTRPSDDPNNANQTALCDGQAIVVHANGGGLRAASLILHDDVYLPAGSILCGSGHISGWHQLNAQ